MISPQVGISYVDLLATALERGGKHVAFVCGERRLTYREVSDLIARIARVLEGRGLRKGDGIAILSGNSAEAFCFQMAALSLGCRYTGLHPLGSLDDQLFVLEDAEIAALAFDPRLFAERAAGLASGGRSLRQVFSFGPARGAEDVLSAASAIFSPGPVPRVPAAEDLAFLVYTGGTTGQPKGVMIPHRALAWNALLTVAEWQWPAEIRFLAATPITHAAGALLLPILLRGGTVFLQTGFDPDAVLATIERERITATFLVPTMLYVLLDRLAERPRDVSSLGLVMYGAAPASPARIAQAHERLGPILMQGYGQTEALTTVTMLRKEDHDPTRPERLESCGRPLAGVRVEVLDDADRPAAVGEVGEICVRGPTVMDGYWKRPELTAETLRGGWLRTGDMARRDEEGFLTIVARKKDMIVSGGFNVFPREIEDILAAHPAVAMAAVIGVPDEKWGEAVKAIVVRRRGAEVTREELVAFVRERKGSVYTPKSVDFIETIPLTAVGKPDKKALRAPYWSKSDRQVH